MELEATTTARRMAVFLSNAESITGHLSRSLRFDMELGQLPNCHA